jgi:prepilin-type N-terminal cleavage/methylation domain-containing protein
MRTHRRSIARAEGFTLIEVIAAMFVLLIGVLGALALIDRANATTVSTRTREAAINTARELIEAARSVPYQRITPAAFEAEVQTLPGLDDEGTAPGWTIKRRGTTFSVVATVCTFDDARDGGGSHAAGGFCVDSAATSATPDRNPEDYRRVRVEVRWNDRGGERVVHQTELINNPGSAGAPAVRTLAIGGIPFSATIAPGTGHVIAAAPNDTLTFKLTTSSRPETLHWLLDGTSQDTITIGSDLAWSFEWPLGAKGTAGSVVDGTYVIGAEAFDAYGVAGHSRSLTVVVNRLPPGKVAGLIGGRNGDPAQPAAQVVDLEWLPNTERDIVGYTVERRTSAGVVEEVCVLENRTSCIDKDPPVEQGLEYTVYAWDTNDANGQPRKGVTPSDPLIVDMGNNPPLAPASVIATLQADGTVKLSWPRPAPVEDPDLGDRIAFYRVYRDGTAFEQRYAEWEDPDAVADYVDGNTGGTAHDYWVTAVDTHFAESAPVKAVWTP